MPDPIPTPHTLDDVALEVRSKNAGPFWMTLDVFLPDDAAYRIADRLITVDVIAELYQVTPESLQIFRIPQLRAVKVSFPRPLVQGSLHDRDIHAGQHHVPLAILPIPGVILGDREQEARRPGSVGASPRRRS